MKSILIVEDNPTMVKALEDNFSFKGYGVCLHVTRFSAMRLDIHISFLQRT